jgi:hypothetical protein
MRFLLDFLVAFLELFLVLFLAFFFAAIVASLPGLQKVFDFWFAALNFFYFLARMRRRVVTKYFSVCVS